MIDKRIKRAVLYSPQGARVVVEGAELWVRTHQPVGHTIHDEQVQAEPGKGRIVAVVPADWVIVLEWP